MRQLTKAAVLVAAAAVAAETLGDDYAAHTMWNCSDEGRGGRHPSPAAACAVTGAVAFRKMLVGGACIACDDDDDGFGPPPPPGTVIIIGPICPEGQHLNDAGECEADHECGDDEIGGGDEDCEACPDGEVPNEDGTACVTCEHAELPMTPGTCACDSPSVDDHAIEWLKDIPREAWEEYESYVCAGNVGPGEGPFTHSTNGQQDVCSVDMTLDVVAALTISIAVAHSHPYFDPKADYSGDNAVQCASTTITSGQKADVFNHVIGRQFSDADMSWSLPTYLVVPLRDEVKVYRPDTNSEESIWTR